jgi:predicted transport protein
MNVKKLPSRLGEINKNTHGSIMKIVEYNNQRDITVKFIEYNGTPIQTNWINFSRGLVRNVFDKSVFDIGFIGNGDYKVTLNSKLTPQYISWKEMLKRCYSEKFYTKHPTYIGCTVVEEWLNFQNFARWYDDNYYEVDGEMMCLDKDILIKGNKIYSPDTVIFVPKSINSLFVKVDAVRGNLPIGVTRIDDTGRYRVKCANNKGKQIHIGCFDSPEEAFLNYKIFKENIIKSVANTYKNKIPNNLYEAMINYVVEITD